MRTKGVGKVAYIRHRYRIVAINAFHFAVVFILMYFRFRQPKLIGDVLMNRKNGAARRIFFSLFCNTHCLLTHRIILR